MALLAKNSTFFPKSSNFGCKNSDFSAKIAGIFRKLCSYFSDLRLHNSPQTIFSQTLNSKYFKN